MKKIIITCFIVVFTTSVSFGQDQKNTRMDDEYFSYPECKQSITEQKQAASEACLKKYGMLDNCSYTSKELANEIRAYCGVDPAPRKQKKKS